MKVLTQKEQFLMLERNWERVLDELREDLDDPVKREEIHAEAVVRLMENYPIHGSNMFNWRPEPRAQNKLEELADYLNYGISEGP